MSNFMFGSFLVLIIVVGFLLNVAIDNATAKICKAIRETPGASKGGE